jgi:hypothetical protein
MVGVAVVEACEVGLHGEVKKVEVGEEDGHGEETGTCLGLAGSIEVGWGG